MTRISSVTEGVPERPGPTRARGGRSRLPGGGLRSIFLLVGARLRRRRGAAALVALAVAGAIVVIGSLFGVGVVTADQATKRALADLKPRDRVIQVNVYADGAGAEARREAVVSTATAPLADFTEPIVKVASVQSDTGFVPFTVVDDVSRWIVVKAGRLPKPCDGGTTCEAILNASFGFASDDAIGTTQNLGGIQVTIVGTGTLVEDDPFDPSEIFALMQGIDPVLGSPRTAALSRTSFWIAPLDPDRTHAWVLDDLTATVDGVDRDLASADAAFVVISPDTAFDAVRAKIGVATSRLVFIGSLIVAVLLAFAVFAAAVEREEVAAEYRRLRVHGARRTQLAAFIAAEAAIPSVAGAILGWAGAAAIVAAIGAAQGAPPLAVLQVSLLTPSAVALIGAIALLALLAVALGIHPASSRLIQPRLIAVAVVPVVVVLAWDRFSQGRLDAGEIAQAASGPGTVLLPGLLGLTVILGSLLVLPPLFRRLARLARRAPLSARLALLSIARDPLRPAATTTLLAFSLGAAVFALGHSATLRQGARDEAAFITGMDVRATSLAADSYFGSDGIGVMRATLTQQGVEVHPAFIQNALSASGRPLTVLGIESAAIPELRGWRADFSASTPSQIAAAIAQPGAWRLPGVDIPTGARQISITVDSTGDAVRLSAVVETHDVVVGPDGALPAGTETVGYMYVRFGDLAGGHEVLTGDLLPKDVEFSSDFPTGWRIVALVASNGGPSASTGPHNGERQQATVTVHDLPGIVDPATPLHLDVSGSHASQLFRGPLRTDGLVLPAVVSPDLADDVDASGVLTISMAAGFDLAVKPVIAASHVPTLTEPGKGSVVVELAPLLLGLNGASPGAGVPNNALILTPDDATAAAVAKRLDEAPFQPMSIQSRPAIEDARANDPFAIGVVWALVVGAVAGIALSLAGIVLAAGARLRDERGELGELEEQGLAPASLEGLAVLQTVVLAVAGALVGAVVGLGLGWVAASSIAVTADGADPVPPLIPVAPWLAIAALVVGIVVVLAVAVAVLARRHFGGRLLREVGR